MDGLYHSTSGRSPGLKFNPNEHAVLGMREPGELAIS